MARTPNAPDITDAASTGLAVNADTELALNPAAAPLLRKATPEIDEKPTTWAQQITVGVFVFVPMLALAASIPFAWGWGLNWHDVVIAAVFYWASGLGITVGYHRYFTHSSFKAKPGLRVALAVAGSLAMEGPVVTWVADHRRHHKYSDKEGDPHSPWRYGDNARALAKGLLWAHVLWLFDPNQTSQEKFVPDLLADKKIRAVDNLFPAIVAFSRGLSAATALSSCAVFETGVPAIFTTTSPGCMPPRLAGPLCSTPVISTPWLIGRCSDSAISGVRSRGSTPIQPRTTCPSRIRLSIT